MGAEGRNLDASLDARLDDYRRTGESWRRNPASLGRTAGYAAATASAFALAGGAEAGVIYSGVRNLTLENVPPGAGFQFNLDLDIDEAFGNDLRLQLYWYTYSRVSGGAYGTYFFYTNRATAGAGGLNGANLLLNASVEARRLSSGQTISAGAGAFGGFLAQMNSYSEFGPERGTWAPSGTGFLGLAFDRGGDTHYGWIRLQLEDQGSFNGPPEGASDKITVVDWAWNNVPGAPILAGAIVPEPSSLQLLASGVLGAMAWRKRNRHSPSDGEKTS